MVSLRSTERPKVGGKTKQVIHLFDELFGKNPAQSTQTDANMITEEECRQLCTTLTQKAAELQAHSIGLVRKMEGIIDRLQSEVHQLRVSSSPPRRNVSQSSSDVAHQDVGPTANAPFTGMTERDIQNSRHTAGCAIQPSTLETTPLQLLREQHHAKKLAEKLRRRTECEQLCAQRRKDGSE
jgi:hypothetical protein